MQYDHVVTIENLADKAVDAYKKYMTRATNLATSKYDVFLQNPLRPEGPRGDNPEEVMDNILINDDTINLDWYISRVESGASEAAGGDKDRGLNQNAMLEEIVVSARSVMLDFKEIAEAAHDIAVDIAAAGEF